jgi:hypothetical protein
MDRQTYRDGEYEVYHVTYSGNYGGDDIVCQVQRYGVEVGHCTWHPNSSVPNRHMNCPYRNGTHCLDK